MKRILTLLFSVIIVLSSVVAVCSADTVYVIDEFDNLTDEALDLLSDHAETASDKYGVDIIFVYTNDASVSAYELPSSVGKYENKVLMVENETLWTVQLFGSAEEIFNEDGDGALLRKAYDAEETYYEGVVAYIDAAAALMSKRTAAETTAADDTADETVPDGSADSDSALRLMDIAGILSDADTSAISARLDELSKKHSFDLAIVSIDTVEDESLTDFANSMFDSSYGYGNTEDGMLLLLVMDTRDWVISKGGFAYTAFVDAGVDYIMDKTLEYLGDDDYAGGFNKYLDLCDDFLVQAKAGSPYTADNLPKEPFDMAMSLIISVAVGLIASFIITGIMKSSLKSVSFKATASDYTKKGSLNITESRDFFLYRTVDRTEKEQEKDSDSDNSSSRNSSGKF